MEKPTTETPKQEQNINNGQEDIPTMTDVFFTIITDVWTTVTLVRYDRVELNMSTFYMQDII